MSSPVRVEPDFLTDWVRAPGARDHKYSRGVVGFATGSATYPGAALIGIEAALRTGVGMVRYFGPAEVASMVVMSHPEVVVAPGTVDACVVGSGLPTPLETPDRDRMGALLALSPLAIVDAGGLDLFSSLDSFPPSILTPHTKELEKLYTQVCGGVARDDATRSAEVAATLGVTVVAKGSLTTITSPGGAVWELPVATPWLATAGTGDALAGILGALAAANRDIVSATPEAVPELAVAGALLHNLAAQKASHRNGGGPITVGDLCSALPGAVGRYLG